jgi:signal transduction histidine kinase
MPAEECSSGFSPAGLKTKSGLLCFSTVKGLVFLDPRRQEPGPPPPTVLLEDVLVNGQPVTPPSAVPRLADGTPGSSSNGSPLGERLVIAPGGREVELHYTAINFGAPERLRFRYRLDNLAQDWTDAGSRRTAYYHHVPSGDFVFRVAACDADGVWSEQPVGLAITVQPYLWETGLFRLVVAIAILGALAWTFRWAAQRKYKLRLARLQTQHAIERERLRISQDMHDHIGGMLTQVSQLSDLGHSETAASPEVRGHFDRIGAHSRAAVQALDEIIWATNPKNDNLPQFAEYVSRFADEFFENSPMRCWQEMPADLPNVPLRADVRHNVFLALREAFHNVLKHSGASELWLRLALADSEARLEIEDNGRGFAVDQTVTRRNGLQNMRTRLAECGGRAEVTSSPGRGTKVRFVFSLAAAD